jgi:hypothetical protein
MYITEKDIGRKVRLRNGQIKTIRGITPNQRFVDIYAEVNYERNGSKCNRYISDEDIVSFLDDEPIIFQLGDIVSFGGLEGVVDGIGTIHTDEYPVSVDFNGDADYFTLDGKYHISHTEPLLKLISRPKKKVKKEVTIDCVIQPYSYGDNECFNMTGRLCLPINSKIINIKAEVEVEE